MAMTQGGLFFLGLLASALAYMGLFRNFANGDRWTRVLVLFTSAIFWGVFGLSSNDVIVGSENMVTTVSQPILAFVYLGYGLAFIIGLFAIFEMFKAIGSDAGDAADGLMQ